MASSSFPNLISTTPSDLASRRDRQQWNNTIFTDSATFSIHQAGHIFLDNSPCKVKKTKHSIYVWAWFSTTGGVGSICRVDNFPSEIIEVFSDEFCPELLTEFKIVNVTYLDGKASRITDALQEWISGQDNVTAHPWPENFRDVWPFRKVWLDLEKTIYLNAKQPGNQEDLWALIEKFWDTKSSCDVYWKALLDSFTPK
ncbi:hypothetical protein OUZ56_018343 [Daphnia magna]|uniref:Uncharacterized protein n=1 Tax=Daphnia magna TaxID=35525 RepID=A0ABQ9Z8Q4_9CRUS|nr:hypothetical protein OUZ56_018343 [Daphnia magna]